MLGPNLDLSSKHALQYQGQQQQSMGSKLFKSSNLPEKVVLPVSYPTAPKKQKLVCPVNVKVCYTETQKSENMINYLALKESLEIFDVIEKQKKASKKLVREISPGIIPDLDSANLAYIRDLGDAYSATRYLTAPRSLNNSMISTESAWRSAQPEHIHRLPFKNLGRHKFYSQILGPPEAGGNLLFSHESKQFQVEKAYALKKLQSLDTYQTKSVKQLKQQKRWVQRRQSVLNSNLHKDFLIEQQQAALHAY